MCCCMPSDCNSAAMFRGLGFESFSSKVGGFGVKWHSEYPHMLFASKTEVNSAAVKSDKAPELPSDDRGRAREMSRSFKDVALDVSRVVAAVSVFCYSSKTTDYLFYSLAGAGLGYAVHGLGRAVLGRFLRR